MVDKSAMFCTSCGTACVLEDNCPQCSMPLKKLGRVGSINDSKRATQHMVNKAAIGLPLDLQSIRRSRESDSSSASAFLTFRAHSPRDETHSSPKQSPRTLLAPALVSPRLIAQSQQMHATSENASPNPIVKDPPETPQSAREGPPSTDRKSYFTSAINRVSAVFTWRSRSTDQKVEEENSTPKGGSSSVPDFVTLSLPHPSVSNSVRVLPPLTNTKVSRRRSSIDGGARCQSTPYISSGKNDPSLPNGSSPANGAPPEPKPLEFATTNSAARYQPPTFALVLPPVTTPPIAPATPSPVPRLNIPNSTMAVPPPIVNQTSSTSSAPITPHTTLATASTPATPTLATPSTPLTPATPPISATPATPSTPLTPSTPASPSTPATPSLTPRFGSPSTNLSSSTNSAPFTYITPLALSGTQPPPVSLSNSPVLPASPPTTSGAASSSPSTDTPSPTSPSSLINSPRKDGAQPTSTKPERPTRITKPKLRVIVNNDHSDSSSDERSTRLFSKSRSTLNVTYNAIPPMQEPIHSPAIHALQKSRPLPSPPANAPPNPFASSGTLSSSPNTPSSFPLASPRVHHTPPKRPLPALPPMPSPKPDSHPIISRRNTVHTDMHVSSTTPTRKEGAPDWLSFLNKRSSLKLENADVPTPTSPKVDVVLIPPVEVAMLPPSPKIEFFYPHITPPPKGLETDEIREKIALELITTEFEYVNDLHTLVLAKTEMERFISKNELSSVFNNVDQIYKVNEAIYRKMLAYCANGHKRRLENSPGSSEDSSPCPSADDKVAAISRTFLGLAHTMKIYVKYSLGHGRAAEKLKMLIETDQYTDLIKEVAAMPGFKGGEISGYLIKPVQRICRYPLLIKEIVKSTPTGHHTLSELAEALECIEQTLVEINEAQRSIERELNLMRAQQDLRLFGMDIDVMSPTRSLILDGPMRLVPVIRKTSGSKVIKKPKQGHYFLFDDFFLFVMNTKKKETPHIFIPADQSLVTDPGDNALEIIHSGQQIWMFVLPSYHDKIFLMQKLNQIIEDNLQEARSRNGGTESKSTLNIATLTRSGKHKKKKTLGDLFGGEK